MIDEWIAGRHYIPFDDYDDPDAHSPLAALAARKSIRRRVYWVPLTIGAVLLGCLVCSLIA